MSFLHLYNAFPFEIEKARGTSVFTKDGEEFIDTFSGIGVTAFGHSYQPINDRIKAKLDRYSHISNFILDKDVKPVAEALIEFTGQEGKVYFSNSGTEAIEAALKLIRKISTPDRNKIIYFSSAFHGRTTGALSVNGIDKQRTPFLPLLSDTVQLPFNDKAALQKYFQQNGDSTIALVVEPIQGAGGVRPMNSDFSDTINRLHQQYEFNLVCDEIQAGLGRTGKLFSYQHFNLKPDLITTAKTLGGGLPLGALLMLGKTAHVFQPGNHGSTYAPSPIALAAARYIVDELPKIMSDVQAKGQYFIDKLKKIQSPFIKEIRGMGLMIAVELNTPDPALRDKLYAENLLTNIIGNKIIRLLPALNTGIAVLDTIAERIERVLSSDT